MTAIHVPLPRPIAVVAVLTVCVALGSGCAPRPATMNTPKADPQSAPKPPIVAAAPPPSTVPLCTLGPVREEVARREITDEEALAAIAMRGQTTRAGDLAGPQPAVAAAPAGQIRRVQGVQVARFGEGWFGFVEWISADARLIAMRRFSREPRISHHGAGGLAAKLELIDTTTGKREQPDDVVATDPRGRWLVVRAGKKLWLIDSETGTRDDLAARGADLEDDANACLMPRQASFDAAGTHVLFIRRRPDRLVQRDLLSGVETEIAAGPGRLWAAAADGPVEHALLIVVPIDSNGDGKLELPRQRTTCACRWCGRFAMATSSHGFDGDDFKFLAVDGARRIEVADPGTPLGAGVFASEDTLTRADGSAYPLPQGCEQPLFVRGSPAVLLTCGAGSGLLWPATDRHSALIGFIRPLTGAAARRHEGKRVVGVTLEVDESLQLATLDLDRGNVERGPAITAVGPADRRGQVLACDAAGLVGHDPLGGVTRRFAGSSIVTDRPGLVRLGGRLHAVDITRGLAHALPGPALGFDSQNNIGMQHPGPVGVAENGCVLLRAGKGRSLDIGPWTLQCPGPDPSDRG